MGVANRTVCYKIYIYVGFEVEVAEIMTGAGGLRQLSSHSNPSSSSSFEY
jgi:hypothetical protein